MNEEDLKSVAAEAYPTDGFSWLMATCSKQLRERLAVRFLNAGFNVSPEQWAILAHLWEQDGLSQQELANRFHRSKVAAFQLIRKLESQGLVMRRSDPMDARSRLVYLTESGRAIQPALVTLAQQNLVGVLEGISRADLETAKAVIRGIVSNTRA
jgi:DNA-binding MarR family transcriptional regulator